MSASISPESEVVRCHDECVRLYPEIRWSAAEFAQAFLEDGGAASPTLDDYVRLACLANCPGAAAVLDREYLRPLRGRIFKICGNADLTELVEQQLRVDLLLPPSKKLESYENTGSLRAWLAVVASRTALDLVRGAAVRARREVELEAHLEALAAGPEQQYESEQLRDAFRSALRAAVKTLPERERQALRLHLVSEWNITQIGRVFQVHRATAARWLIAAKEQLLTSLREQLAARLGTSAPDPARIFQELPSRLDVRLSQVFATTGISRALLG